MTFTKKQQSAFCGYRDPTYTTKADIGCRTSMKKFQFMGFYQKVTQTFFGRFCRCRNFDFFIRTNYQKFFKNRNLSRYKKLSIFTLNNNKKQQMFSKFFFYNNYYDLSNKKKYFCKVQFDAKLFKKKKIYIIFSKKWILCCSGKYINFNMVIIIQRPFLRNNIFKL